MRKYHNQKTTIDGITFDSKKEAEYYCELKLRKRAKEIKDFDLQPKFVLQEGFTKNGKRYREIAYIADFLIEHNDGRKEIVDTKGYKTDEFRLKQKLFEKKYEELTLTVI